MSNIDRMRPSARSWRGAAAVMALGLLLMGCGTGPTTITSDPPGAFIRIGDQNVGTTPVNFRFDFERFRTYHVVAGAEGFHPYQVRVHKQSAMLQSNTLHMVLEEDPAYKATVESEAANRWRRIQVDRAIGPDETWQKIVDSVTTVYDRLEQLDSKSGYLRSVRKVRAFGNDRAGFKIRTQFIGSIASKSPLTYKYKIRSEILQNGQRNEEWELYPRIFRGDEELNQELQSRLQIK